MGEATDPGGAWSGGSLAGPWPLHAAEGPVEQPESSMV